MSGMRAPIGAPVILLPHLPHPTLRAPQRPHRIARDDHHDPSRDHRQQFDDLDDAQG